MDTAMTHDRKGLGKKLLIILLAIFLIFICVSPLLFMAWNSPKTSMEYGASKFAVPLSTQALADNLKVLIANGIFKNLFHSVVVVVIGVILSGIFTSMAGFAFSKLKFPGRNFIYWGVIGLLAIPAQVFVIPLYVFYAKLNIIDNLFSLALFYSVWSFSLGTFLMTSFYRGIPDELIDSAQIDGANSFQTYLRIMLPLGKPGIIAVGLINFFWFWNDLFISMIFNRTSESRLITSFLALFNEEMRTGAQLTNWPLIFTGSLTSLIIPLIIYIIFQNRLVEGLTAGAVKG